MSARSLTRAGPVLAAILLFNGGWLRSPAIHQAADRSPRQQPPGLHSTICTNDSQIRDDQLALQVANQIVAHGGQVGDVVVIVNTCYGGGLLEDFAFVFSPGGPCPSVPWVFGSASEWYEQAWAFRADWCQDPTSNLGSKFTSALAGPHSGRWNPTPGAMRSAGAHLVQADLLTARQNDEAGPNHERWESPVIAVGNGGEAIAWSATGAGHEGVLFGGVMDQPAYYNDMENMQAALQSLYGAAPHTIQVIPDGTLQDLLDGISGACAGLDANTQLLLHFTDHGGFAFDVVEHLQSQGQQPPYSIPHFQDYLIWLPPLPWPPWPGGPPPPPPPQDDVPLLDFRLLWPIDGRHWIICLNDEPLPLPPGPLEDEFDIPLPWESFRAGENHLTIEAVGEPSGPFVFDVMQLSSGPVAIQTEPVPLAAVSTALAYSFTAPWLPGSSVPFQIPPQAARPAWSQSGPLTYHYSDPRWPDRQGFWGLSGPEQTAVLSARLHHTYSPAERQRFVITADIRTDDADGNAWNVVVRPADTDGLTPAPAHRPQMVSTSPNPDASVTCTWEQELTPVGRFADVAFTLKTGAGGDNYVFVDHVTIYAVGLPKDKPLQDPHAPPPQDSSRSQYYYFAAPEWPPAPHYEVLPTWQPEVQWERFGACPPEWLPVVGGRRGVIGLPGGFPADGQLVVGFDDQAEPEGRTHISYQFDYHPGGGWLWWEPVVSPGSMIANVAELIEDLGDGWLRAYVTFDAVPPPAWQEFHWFLFADESSGPVAIDNFALSSSSWWADYWHDAFDFHAAGQGLHGRYGWKGWDNNPLADGMVTDAQAHTPFNSLAVQGTTDLVQEFDLPAGRYLFTAWQYVPSDLQSGCDPTGAFCGSFLILLNTYQDGGPYHWSVQLHADALTETFIRDQPAPAALPLVTDRWVPIDVLIDLVADTHRVFYDGAELGAAASWSAGVFSGGGGALEIGAVDLYANDSTEVYYDDVYVRLLAAGDLDGDGHLAASDFPLFAAAMAGPDMTTPPPGVPAVQFALADQDGDLDVDLADFACFQATAATRPAP